MAKRIDVVHYSGADLGCATVVFYLIVIGVFLSILIAIAPMLAVILPVLVLILAAVFIYWLDRKFTTPKNANLLALKLELEKTLRKYTAVKAGAASLSQNDRELAKPKLAKLRDDGKAQLTTLRGELVKAKESVLEKLGDLPAEELAAQLVDHDV